MPAHREGLRSRHHPHPSTPSLRNDCKVAEAIKAQKPDTKIGFVGAHRPPCCPRKRSRLHPRLTGLAARNLITPARKFPKAATLSGINGLSYKDKDGKIKHNAERELIHDMDALPWVGRCLPARLGHPEYFNGYLQHPYMSMYTGRGCPAQCTFCLWPQTHRRPQISRPFRAECRR